MTVTSALARWSSSSNRRRLFEALARVAPWLAAGTLGAILAIRHLNLYAGIGIAAAFALGVTIALVRMLRRSWHGPDSMARRLDKDHASSDLLATALSIEWRGPEGRVEEVVMERASELLPKVDPVAVDRLRLRPSIIGTMLTAGAVAVLLFAGMRTPAAIAAEPPSALSDAEKEAAKAISDTLDQLEKDESLSPEARNEIAKARESLKAAGDAKSQAAALAALSDAMRHLDAAAPKMRNQDLSKLSNEQLAKQMAQAAADDDRSKLAQLAKEAMKRAAQSQNDAQSLGDALKSAAIAKSDPFKDSPDKSKRLSQLGSAADHLKQNDVDAAKDALSSLTTPTPGSRPRTDPRTSKLDAARAAIAAMRSSARSSVGSAGSAGSAGSSSSGGSSGSSGAGGSSGASPGSSGSSGSSGRPGTGSSGSSGSGMGSGMGMGSGSGSGSGGMGMRPGSGAMPGSAGAMSILGDPRFFGQQGTSGLQGNSPSGAEKPGAIGAERVQTNPNLSPEGIIKAIQDYSVGDHKSEQFGPVRDHYQELAEAAIHRDEIPLTRRDFIQKYFEALRNQGAK